MPVALNAPYYLLHGGWLDGSSRQEAGSYGYYWSSTSISSDNAYSFYIGMGGSNGGDYRYYGLSVRCVAAG